MHLLYYTSFSVSIFFSFSSLLKGPKQKKLKFVVPEEDVQEAETFALKCFQDGLIPVFEAEGTEVAVKHHISIAYCEYLKPTTTDYVFSNICCDNANNEMETVVLDNSLYIIKLKGTKEYFAASDLRI